MPTTRRFVPWNGFLRRLSSAASFEHLNEGEAEKVLIAFQMEYGRSFSDAASLAPFIDQAVEKMATEGALTMSRRHMHEALLNGRQNGQTVLLMQFAQAPQEMRSLLNKIYLLAVECLTLRDLS